MTPAQLTAFKAAMLADGTVTPLIAAGDHFSIAAYYNGNSNPVVNVWKPVLAVRDLAAVIDWSAYAALAVAKQNAYAAMTAGGSVDATSAGIRAGFNTVFGAGATLTALTALASRVGTRFEALFTTNNVSAVFGQSISPADVAQALGSS